MQFLLAVPLLAASLAANAAPPAAVVCHYTYGGETRAVVAEPVANPYAVAPIAVGSYFKFRVVFQSEPADLASIKLYTYADRDSGPVLIQQASYPYPVPAGHGGGYGFTGRQKVYEPVRDGELEYWCDMAVDKKGQR